MTPQEQALEVAKEVLSLPWDQYQMDTEHQLLSDYGGDCAIESTVYCQRCLDPFNIESKKLAQVIEVPAWRGTSMDQVVLAMLKHEQEAHPK